ncbi:hypothetical protein [Catenuloplanes atrovinosus]|uniref:Uncharacterized protein n=1 Tax=Catenuloplanes atrovinosus TaxID=137266 RepID=A0AAE4C9G4_9ACTN|nr:hypothetical protein [Catenuloplanes atrovinosus]MDR7275787.1 hypothetical protein [Catenuloplanes atrovinosus]
MLATALVLIVLTVGYFLVTTLVDLFPFNNVRDVPPRDRRTEVAVNAPILAAPAVLLAVAAALGVPWPAWVAAAIEVLALIGGLTLWWLPYLTGVSVPWAAAGTGLSWPEFHARGYARTVTVLPRIGDRPRPNLEHTILHALMAGAAASAITVAAGR